MEIITARDLIRQVSARWSEQYRTGADAEQRRITKKLAALNPAKASKKQVEEIIGNKSWTNHMCSDCGEYATPVVSFGRYEESQFVVCAACVKKAYRLASSTR